MTGTLRHLSLIAGDDSRPDLGSAVRDSIAEMGWLSPSDRALSALAQFLAEQIEATDDLADVSRLSAQLLAALRDLGGTPGARNGLGGIQQPRGKLAQLRAASDAAG